MPTGSSRLDSLLGGGISTCAVTDIFGAAGSGKTQFAFQCSAFVSSTPTNEPPDQNVAFVDCSGSFRPERILEIAEKRKIETSKMLDSILAIKVRTVAEQVESSERILGKGFSNCKLIVVDDVTRNFVSEYGSGESGIIPRQHALGKYVRRLTYIALSKNIAVLLTNSARSRMDAGERETTGDLISQFALFRIHFFKKELQRSAELLQPTEGKQNRCDFEITEEGLVP
ncbi:MAG TPA: hypothetical protein VJN71_02400 [Nitrososphaerales archaeon]|nr:hypothetical protein [Nitrososphaerales archaeon]